MCVWCVCGVCVCVCVYIRACIHMIICVCFCAGMHTGMYVCTCLCVSVLFFLIMPGGYVLFISSIRSQNPLGRKMYVDIECVRGCHCSCVNDCLTPFFFLHDLFFRANGGDPHRQRKEIVFKVKVQQC